MTGWRSLWTRVREDALIDRLINEKGVQAYRPGMDTVNWQTVEKIGARRWASILRAQRQTQKAEIREWPKRVNER